MSPISHSQLPDTGQRTHHEIDVNLPEGHQKQALTGSQGTPSANNLYLTQEDAPATPAASRIVRLDAKGSILATSPVAARVYNSEDLTIANTTPTYLTFDSETFDTGGCHEAVTNPSRLTIPAGAGGTYIITAHVEWEAGSGTRTIEIIVKCTTVIALATRDSSIPLMQNLATVYTLTAGQYVEIRVTHNSGSNEDITRSAAYSPEFTIARLA